MTQFFKATALVLLVLATILLAIYSYYGGFEEVNVSVAEAGGEVAVYEEMTGDYGQSGVVMGKIYKTLLEEDSVETLKGFGIYFDNPQNTEKSKLRSEVGCLIQMKDFGKLPTLKTKYSIRTLPKKHYIVAEFPFKGKMSIFLSLIKVYPALDEYAKQYGYNTETEVIEIYDMPNEKILYRKEIEKQL